MPFRKSCWCGAGAAQVAECKWENGQPAVAGPFRGARNFIPMRSCAIMRHPHSLRSKATSFFLPSFLSQFAHCVRPSVRPSVRPLVVRYCVIFATLHSTTSRSAFFQKINPHFTRGFAVRKSNFRLQKMFFHDSHFPLLISHFT